MNQTRLGALLGAFTLVFALSGCVADGTYYNGGPGYYGGGGGGGYYGGGGGYGPGYYGAPGPVVVAGGPVYRETVVVDNTRYRGRDGYYNGRRSGPYASGYRRGGGGYSRRGGAVAAGERRTTSRRVPPPVHHRGDKKQRDPR